MTDTSKPRPRFNPGLIGVSPEANRTLNLKEISAFITRHVHGDWGDIESNRKIALDYISTERRFGACLISEYTHPRANDVVRVYTNGKRTETILFVGREQSRAFMVFCMPEVLISSWLSRFRFSRGRQRGTIS